MPLSFINESLFMRAPFFLPKLNAWGQKKFLNYALQVLEAQQTLMAEGRHLLHYTLNDKMQYEHMVHYPQGDRIDFMTGAQYFYHCHRENFATTEHGHFHCFMRYKAISKRVKPSDYYMNLSGKDCIMTHLIAIGMNQLGQPIRLFTVNQWVTAEVWYEAPHMQNFLKKYKMTLTDSPYWQVLDKWIEGMLHLFSPQINWLLKARDESLAQALHDDPHSNPLTNKNLEELSELQIDLKKQVEWVMGIQQEQEEQEEISARN